MWNPISIDRYVKIHLNRNDQADEKEFICGAFEKL